MQQVFFTQVYASFITLHRLRRTTLIHIYIISIFVASKTAYR